MPVLLAGAYKPALQKGPLQVLHNCTLVSKYQVHTSVYSVYSNSGSTHPHPTLLYATTPEHEKRLWKVEEIKATVEEAVFLRAKHVVSENARTVEAAVALKAGDYQTVGGLMLDSHRSLSEVGYLVCTTFILF